MLDFSDDLFRLLVAVRRRQARLDPVHGGASLLDQITTAMISPLDADETEALTSILSEVRTLVAQYEQYRDGLDGRAAARPREIRIDLRDRPRGRRADKTLLPVAASPNGTVLVRRALRLRTNIETLLAKLTPPAAASAHLESG